VSPRSRDAPSPAATAPGEKVDTAALSPRSRLVAEVQKEIGNILTADLLELAASGALAEVPKNDEGKFSSVGSIGHARADCMPCAYWFRGFCKFSVTCKYCHFSHEGQKKKRLRPSKVTRQRNKLKEGCNQEDGGSGGDNEDADPPRMRPGRRWSPGNSDDEDEELAKGLAWQNGESKDNYFCLGSTVMVRNEAELIVQL